MDRCFQTLRSCNPIFLDVNDPLTSVSNLVQGNYIFEWSINYGKCPAEPDSINLYVGQPPTTAIESIFPPDDNNENGDITFTSPLGGTPPYSFSIDSINFTTDRNFNNLTGGIYTLYLLDSINCTYSAEFKMLFIPTAFSPNGDGTNDLWTLNGLDEFPNAAFDIYTAWGNLIHNGSNIDGVITWDGMHNGNPSPEANYYYILHTNPDAANDRLLKGTITLIR